MPMPIWVRSRHLGFRVQGLGPTMGSPRECFFGNVVKTKFLLEMNWKCGKIPQKFFKAPILKLQAKYQGVALRFKGWEIPVICKLFD